MPYYKIKVAETNYYEFVVWGLDKVDAENRIIEEDYTKGRNCSSDKEFKNIEKFWIESIKELPNDKWGCVPITKNYFIEKYILPNESNEIMTLYRDCSISFDEDFLCQVATKKKFKIIDLDD